MSSLGLYTIFRKVLPIFFDEMMNWTPCTSWSEVNLRFLAHGLVPSHSIKWALSQQLGHDVNAYISPKKKNYSRRSKVNEVQGKLGSFAYVPHGSLSTCSIGMTSARRHVARLIFLYKKVTPTSRYAARILPCTCCILCKAARYRPP